MLCDSRWRLPHPRPAKERRVGALPGLSSIRPKAGLGVIPQLLPPGARDACKRGVFVRASAPPPGWGGGGGEEGADGSNYSSDPPPPVAGGRKIGSLRFPGREGRRPPQRALQSR